MSELDYWNGRLIGGAISRREFMGRAAALGASSLAISTMLASAGAIAADAPKSGGVLKLGLAGGSTTDSLDFRTTTNSVMIDCQSRHLELPRRSGARTEARIRNWRRAGRRPTAPRTGSSSCARA